jgi:hypothetical protein
MNALAAALAVELDLVRVIRYNADVAALRASNPLA